MCNSLLHTLCNLKQIVSMIETTCHFFCIYFSNACEDCFFCFKKRRFVSNRAICIVFNEILYVRQYWTCFHYFPFFSSICVNSLLILRTELLNECIHRGNMRCIIRTLLFIQTPPSLHVLFCFRHLLLSVIVLCEIMLPNLFYEPRHSLEILLCLRHFVISNVTRNSLKRFSILYNHHL